MSDLSVMSIGNEVLLLSRTACQKESLIYRILTTNDDWVKFSSRRRIYYCPTLTWFELADPRALTMYFTSMTLLLTFPLSDFLCKCVCDQVFLDNLSFKQIFLERFNVLHTLALTNECWIKNWINGKCHFSFSIIFLQRRWQASI